MDSHDGCLRKRSQCHCFRDCTDIKDKEFHKIFELEDTGVALYRYVPLNQDPENTIGDIYVLRTTDDFEMEPDELTTTFAKNKISCPRCIKLVENAEKSLTGRLLIKQQTLAGICDHCWRPVAKMQKLVQLSKKRERLSAPEAIDAMKAQMEQEKGVEEETKIQVKERPKSAKRREKSKVAVNPKDVKQKTSADKSTKKVKETKVKEKSTTDHLKDQIALEKLRKAKERSDEAERRKELERQQKLAELAAEKVARDAELQRQAKAKAAPQKKLISHDSDSDEDTRDHTTYKSPVFNEMVIGEKICKNTRDKCEDVGIIAKSLTKKLRKSAKSEIERGKCDRRPTLETEKYRPVVGPEVPTKGNAAEKRAGVPAVDAVEDEKSTIKTIQDRYTATISTTWPSHKKTEAGPISYALSNRTFIEKGWTLLPSEKVVRKMNIYRMRPSKPEFDWFEQHKNRVLQYDTGERLAEVDRSGRGRWYYRSGALAMDYYDAQETNAGQRFVVYSSEAKDARGRLRPPTVLATFDHSGNGIVFDHAGKTRLKYNQSEGIVLDRDIGPVSCWKWHTLNDPPVLQRVMIDTQMPRKDPTITRMGPDEELKQQDEAMLSIELDNVVKEKLKKSAQEYKPFQIKMKALKINENFSLRVLDQASIYLLFRDGSTTLKINIGMLLDNKEIVDTDSADIGEVSLMVEKLPACTPSISALQRTVARAQKNNVGRLAHIESVDALRAGVSRPIRTTLFTCGASATHETPKLFKPCSCDLY